MSFRITANPEGLQQAFPYPRSDSGAISDLANELIARISNNGPTSFHDYMAECLYHPTHGYYSRPETPTASKEGDFMTSISVGPVFGQLLARRFHKFWTANGSPDSFTIVEIGAHDGALALDILDYLPALDPQFAKATHYVISEPLPQRCLFLQDRLGERATIISKSKDIQAKFGVLVANEVLDALPVPLYLRTQNEWREAAVDHDGKAFQWATLPDPINLSYDGDFPDGFVTEGDPDLNSFLGPLSEIFEKGLFTFIDYGMDEASLHHPARSAGTLRCYRNHQSNAHPLDFPGEQDLTEDVNFTSVENAARDLGLTQHLVTAQGRFLVHCAKEWLLKSPSPGEVSQFQTLIHPGQFGNRFYFCELTKGDVDYAFPGD
ncbi:MAG: SAM-dependent methyltransferase [Akkermansiaceae bacterium]|nr:SAM-dependent methyltransferase [Akkermansiaceae bacterium]